MREKEKERQHGIREKMLALHLGIQIVPKFIVGREEMTQHTLTQTRKRMLLLKGLQA